MSTVHFTGTTLFLFCLEKCNIILYGNPLYVPYGPTINCSSLKEGIQSCKMDYGVTNVFDAGGFNGDAGLITNSTELGLCDFKEKMDPQKIWFVVNETWVAYADNLGNVIIQCDSSDGGYLVTYSNFKVRNADISCYKEWNETNVE